MVVSPQSELSWLSGYKALTCLDIVFVLADQNNDI